jgi:SPP1 gp7 family putative phage head morphogenesis protein
MPEMSWTPLPFEEAIRFFQGKITITPEQYAALSDAAKQLAFSVADVARQDVLDDLKAAIGKAIEAGTTIEQFKSSVREVMPRRGWEGTNPYRLDTIFRTNIQQAYQAGHLERMMETVNDRPYWQYVAVMDGRTRPGHAAMNGRVLPHDHPFWQKNFPPNGFNCRCTVISRHAQELKREGLQLTRKAVPDVFDKGFGSRPVGLSGGIAA